ncbi:hypothetical protein [Aquamicrobium soli]|jgi:hypothetical protein|uniref:Secreted protein n=1 Tax=Aquamicrobium soli TaxID=1811518 RepID=A0ABV7K6D5_9HYPH
MHWNKGQRFVCLLFWCLHAIGAVARSPSPVSPAAGFLLEHKGQFLVHLAEGRKTEMDDERNITVRCARTFNGLVRYG